MKIIKYQKLNNKGVSLIELIISITLISVVSIFMYKMIIDVNNEITNAEFAINNQENRIEIIKAIEQDIINKDFDDKIIGTNSLTLNFKDGQSCTITIENADNKYYIVYQDTNDNSRRWAVKNAYINMDNGIVYDKKILNSNTNEYLITVSIMINNINENNSGETNNILDDITISYYGSGI